MLDTLKGPALWAAGIIVLAVVGAVTYLASQGTMSGSDVMSVVILILTGVVGITSAHVASQSAITAVQTPAPLPPPPVQEAPVVTANEPTTPV